MKRFTKKSSSFGTVILFLLLARVAGAQSALGGTIVSAGSGAPIAGAFVQIGAGATIVESDSAGSFLIPEVSAGVHTLMVKALGYKTLAMQVTTAPGAPALRVELVPDVGTLGIVTVIGTRSDLDEVRQRLRQIPGAVSMVTSSELRATRQANLKDALAMTPGVYAQPRFGAADETQISVRGSGLRDNFHARGINLLVNGMPYRNADGFTDFESLEMLTTEAIEVYKGGNALRYGGSTLGGAINLDTKTGYTASDFSPFTEAGSFGFYKAQVESGANRDGADYYASYARTSLDGYRAWSGQSRDRVNLHAGYQITPSTDARLFYFFARVHERLPGSLTRAELDSAPRSADPTNVGGKWGREYDLHHVGLQVRTQIGANQRFELSPYLQYRDIDHPIFEVISQLSHDYGIEARYENDASIGGAENRFVLAVQGAWETMRNRQFENVGGKHGALTKNQQDGVEMVAIYSEDVYSVTPALQAVAGARFDHSVRHTRDSLLSNGDQSDRRTYDPFTPKIGLIYSSAALGQLFANVSRSFEPPLLLELNSLTVPGFIKLAGQSALQYELGARTQTRNLNWDASLYDIELRNEILNVNVEPFAGAPFTVPTYRNSPQTRHYGAEVGASYSVDGGGFARRVGGQQLTLRAAYTLGVYRFVRDSAYAGNAIPGAPRHHITGEIKYSHPNGLSVTPSVEWVPQRYFVNSANTVANSGWHTWGLRLEWSSPHWRSEEKSAIFLSMQNIGNAKYSGSVQVDNAAGKYFEPSDRRAIYFGGRWVR